MLPHLGTGQVVPVQVPPPAKFRRIAGEPRNVYWQPSMERPSAGLTPAQKAGLRYEAKAQLFLRGNLGKLYQTAPIIHFEDRNGLRSCIPDGIYFGVVPTIFEIKSQHMPEAWWQLRMLYAPVIRAFFSNKRSVRVVEVTKSYDPAMPFPEPTKMVSGLDRLVELVKSDDHNAFLDFNVFVVKL